MYRFRKYVSYSIPIISFCIPGVHFETPCIIEHFRHFNKDILTGALYIYIYFNNIGPTELNTIFTFYF